MTDETTTKNGNGHAPKVKRVDKALEGFNLASTELGALINALLLMERYKILKQCPKCEQYKDIELDYGTNNTQNDKRQTYCKTCQQALDVAAKEKKKEKESVIGEIASLMKEMGADDLKALFSLLRGDKQDS